MTLRRSTAGGWWIQGFLIAGTLALWGCKGGTASDRSDSSAVPISYPTWISASKCADWAYILRTESPGSAPFELATALTNLERGDHLIGQNQLNGLLSSDDRAVALVSRTVLVQRALVAHDWGSLCRHTNADDPLGFAARFFDTRSEESLSLMDDITIESLDRVLIVVRGSVGGHAATFLIDTGSSATLISESLARRCGAVVAEKTVDVVNTPSGRSLPATPAVLPELACGNLIAREYGAFVVDPGSLRLLPGLFRDGAVDGILGWDVLRRVRVTFDVPNRRVTFCRPVASPARQRNLLDLARPIVRSQLEGGIPVRVLLDTGASNIEIAASLYDSLPADRQTELFGRVQQTSRDVLELDGHRDVVGRRAERLSFMCGGTSFRLRGVFIGSYASPVVSNDLILGVEALQECSLTIDATNGIAQIERAR